MRFKSLINLRLAYARHVVLYLSKISLPRRVRVSEPSSISKYCPRSRQLRQEIERLLLKNHPYKVPIAAPVTMPIIPEVAAIASKV